MELLLIAAAFALLTRKSEAGQAGGKASDFHPISLPGGLADKGIYTGPMTSDGKPCPPEWVQQVQCIQPPCRPICAEPGGIFKGP